MRTTSPLSDPKIIPNPYPIYADLAQREPIHWCESLDAWAVLKFRDCVSGLRDSRLKADRMSEVLDAKYPGAELGADSIYHRFTKNIMMFTDPPLHGALRRSTEAAFTRTAHQHYAGIIEHVASDLVAAIPRTTTEIDAVEIMTAKLPVDVAVRAFGVPGEDLSVIVPHVQALMTYWSGPQAQPLGLDGLLEHLTDLHEYSTELLTGQRCALAPGTVIARLAASEPGGSDSRAQGVHQLVLLLMALFAPTTPGSISSGLLSFAMNARQVERYLTKSTCAENAANEVLRYNASNQFTWRIADEPFKMGNVDIEKGQLVALFLGAANRDADMFPAPDVFDLDRSNSAKHLSFGTGLHSCLGRQIATLQIQRFFAAFFSRFPRIRLAGSPVWNSNLEFRSLASLPLSLR
jgi:hypothetical protein